MWGNMSCGTLCGISKSFNGEEQIACWNRWHAGCIFEVVFRKMYKTWQLHFWKCIAMQAWKQYMLMLKTEHWEMSTWVQWVGKIISHGFYDIISILILSHNHLMICCPLITPFIILIAWALVDKLTTYSNNSGMNNLWMWWAKVLQTGEKDLNMQIWVHASWL